MWLYLLSKTNSRQLKERLEKIVIELQHYQEKANDVITTDDGINLIIQRLTNHLKSVNAMVRHYKSSWVNLNSLELLSMIKPVLIYFIGILETTGNPSEQKIRDLMDKINTTLADVVSAIEYFKKLKNVSDVLWAGAIISGIATVPLLFVSSAAAGITALTALGLGAAAYMVYSGLQSIVDMTESDGEDKGYEVVATQI